MNDMMKCQSSDAANAAGFGTKQLSENQGDYAKANAIKDGGVSGKGQNEPALETGTR